MFLFLASGTQLQRKVIIEQETETTISFVDGAQSAYFGYCTVKFSPDKNSSAPHQLHYAVQVTENASPIIDHCSITSSSVGKYICSHSFMSLSFILQLELPFVLRSRPRIQR